MCHFHKTNPAHSRIASINFIHRNDSCCLLIIHSTLNTVEAWSTNPAHYSMKGRFEMKTTTGFINHSAIDLTTRSTQTAQKGQSKQLIAWNKIWYSLVKAIAGSNEPQIRQSVDRNGSLIWHVYDPQTHHSACFSSEKEVRIWLDQRYYS
jgi:hypothetical protein